VNKKCTQPILYLMQNEFTANCESAHTLSTRCMRAARTQSKRRKGSSFANSHERTIMWVQRVRVDCIYGNAAALTGTQISEQVHTMKLDLSVAEQTMLLFSCLGIKKKWRDRTGGRFFFYFMVRYLFYGSIILPWSGQTDASNVFIECNLIIHVKPQSWEDFRK
jgi:hypothetical protein